MPGALDGCDMSNVMATFNHSQDMPLARNTVTDGTGSLALNIDGIGLHFNCKPTRTTYASDLKENIRSNVVNQCSFAFDIDEEDEEAETISWNEQDKIYERLINKIKTLYDVSVVTTPAYQDTEAVVASRCKEKIEELRNKNIQNRDMGTQENECDCICSNCNHGDNCQFSGAQCCICANCSMVSQCSKPGSDGCRCSDCSLAANNCCQPNSDNCMCSMCNNIDCQKGHEDMNADTNNNNMVHMQMNSKNSNEELRKKLILKTYL